MEKTGELSRVRQQETLGPWICLSEFLRVYTGPMDETIPVSGLSCGSYLPPPEFFAGDAISCSNPEMQHQDQTLRATNVETHLPADTAILVEGISILSSAGRKLV